MDYVTAALPLMMIVVPGWSGPPFSLDLRQRSPRVPSELEYRLSDLVRATGELMRAFIDATKICRASHPSSPIPCCFNCLPLSSQY